MKSTNIIKSFMCIGLAAVAAVANAALWEGLKPEEHVSGPQITERDLLGKVVLYHVLYGTLFRLDASKMKGEELEEHKVHIQRATESENRIEALWKSYDKKRFVVVGLCPSSVENPAAEAAKRKLTFPIYKDVKLASDSGVRREGAVVIVSPFGKVLCATAGTSDNDYFIDNRDAETMLSDAVTAVGLPPTIIPGVTLAKYKALKNKLKLGVNLKGVIKQLEKDVAAAEKKSATKPIKDKAEEASAILSGIQQGKSEITENIRLFSEINPPEALSLLEKYVKSFPDEAVDYKDQIAELKVKAAEFKKGAK